MDKLATVADIIIPGHDNYFLVDCVALEAGCGVHGQDNIANNSNLLIRLIC